MTWHFRFTITKTIHTDKMYINKLYLLLHIVALQFGVIRSKSHGGHEIRDIGVTLPAKMQTATVVSEQQ